MNHEGHDMADWFNAQGITYAVLKYRMPNGHHDVPLSDAHQAIRLMREHANEWHIQKVGIMGASAGGHLASTAATAAVDDVHTFPVVHGKAVLVDHRLQVVQQVGTFFQQFGVPQGQWRSVLPA